MKASQLLETLKHNIQATGDFDVCVMYGDETKAEPIDQVLAFLFATNPRQNMYLLVSPRQKGMVDRLMQKAGAPKIMPAPIHTPVIKA